jgi:phosphate transport system permease protein
MGHFSSFSGGIALAFIMLPLVIKSTEETLLRIPPTYKEAALALGAPYYRTMIQIILPTGLQGILTGVILGMARVSGESAPLLFTAFGNPFVSFSLSKPIHALPLMIFTYATSPYDSWQHFAWGGSFLLLIFVLCLTFLTKVVSR